MTDVAYYDLHILLCHCCNYNSIAKTLAQGATEVTISRVKITQIFLEHCKNIRVILTLVMVASVAFSIYMVSYYNNIQPELLKDKY